eukprot:g50933.t1
MPVESLETEPSIKNSYKSTPGLHPPSGGCAPYIIAPSSELTRRQVMILSAGNCFSGGVLLAAGLVHMLPDCINDAWVWFHWEGPTPYLFVMLGVLIPFMVEKSALLQLLTGARDLKETLERRQERRESESYQSESYQSESYPSESYRPSQQPPVPAPQKAAAPAKGSLAPPRVHSPSCPAIEFSFPENEKGSATGSPAALSMVGPIPCFSTETHRHIQHSHTDQCSSSCPDVLVCSYNPAFAASSSFSDPDATTNPYSVVVMCESPSSSSSSSVSSSLSSKSPALQLPGSTGGASSHPQPVILPIAAADTSLLHEQSKDYVAYGSVGPSATLQNRMAARPRRSSESISYRPAAPLSPRSKLMDMQAAVTCLICKSGVLGNDHLLECRLRILPFRSLTGLSLQAIRNGATQEEIREVAAEEEEIREVAEEEVNSHSSAVPYLLVTVLAFHSFFTGGSFGAATRSSAQLGLLVGIMAHKWFAAFALGMSFKSSQIPLRHAAKGIGIFSLMTPLGILFGFTTRHVISSSQSQLFQVVFNGIAAGTFLYISLVEVLLEEFDSARGTDKDSWIKLVSFSVGLIGMSILAYYV